MEYPCAKFGDFGLSRFGFYRADRQTDRQTESQMRMIATLTRQHRLLSFSVTFVLWLLTEVSVYAHIVQLNCCGATGPQDYLYSAWFNHTRDFTGVFVPSTCCHLLPPADPRKPQVKDENLCQVEAIVHRATMQPITQLHTKVEIVSN